ncbi:hypothetical protein EIP86_009107 [Pleurotus ostreatoroseus]|nr:hypothetical protein EIP86_009107 [Pleurotus ostreatoroseus]
MPARKTASKAHNKGRNSKAGSKIPQPQSFKPKQQQQPQPAKTKIKDAKQPGAARATLGVVGVEVEEAEPAIASSVGAKSKQRDTWGTGKNLPSIPPQSPIEISFTTSAGARATGLGWDGDGDALTGRDASTSTSTEPSEYSEQGEGSLMDICIEDMLAELKMPEGREGTGGEPRGEDEDEDEWPVINSAYPWTTPRWEEKEQTPTAPVHPINGGVPSTAEPRTAPRRGEIKGPTADVEESQHAVIFFEDHLELLASSSASGLVALPRPPGLEDTPVGVRDPLDSEDVLGAILGYLDPGDLARAARVNSTWNVVATRVMWREVGEQAVRRILSTSPGFRDDGDSISLDPQADWGRFRLVIAPCIESLTLDLRPLLFHPLLRTLLETLGKLRLPRLRTLNLQLHAYDRNQVELAMRFALGGACVSVCAMTVWWRSRYVVAQAAVVLTGISERMRARMPLLDEFRFNVEWEGPYEDELDVVGC